MTRMVWNKPGRERDMAISEKSWKVNEGPVWVSRRALFQVEETAVSSVFTE